MIQIKQGLKIGLLVLELLRDDLDLKDIDVYVECFINCREGGLTFTVRNNDKRFTYCIYEHRNSDEIIINGKENWTSFTSDLPYSTESKWGYLKSFKYGEYEEVYKYLKEEFLKFK